MPKIKPAFCHLKKPKLSKDKIEIFSFNLSKKTMTLIYLS